MCESKKVYNKYNLEIANKIFNENNCVLLANVYKDCDTKMPYVCSCGNKAEITLRKFRSGQRCKECGNKKVAEVNRKHTLEEAKEIFEQEGCILLATEFKDCTIRMPYICQCHEQSFISLREFIAGTRCKECGNKKRANTKRHHTLEDAKKIFAEHGHILLATEYNSITESLPYICRCGNKSNKSLRDLINNQSDCPDCYSRENRKKNSITTIKVAEYFESQGCKLLSEYVDCDTPLEYECSCGNKNKVKFYKFKKGNRCKECGIKKVADFNRLTQEFVEQYFKEHDCQLLDKYIKSTTPVKFQCECGNISHISFSSFSQGHRCSECRIRKITSALRFSLDEVRNIFESYGCKLLSETYTNINEKLDFICTCGSIGNRSLAGFKRCQKCQKCLQEERSGENHPCWNIDREYIKLRNKISRITIKMINRCLNFTNEKKLHKSEILLGYKRIDLLNHLQSHPNWEIVKNLNWEVDHIFPIKAFIQYRIVDLKIINALDNLRPLEKKENGSKGSKYNKEEFENYLTSKGINFESQLIYQKGAQC